MGEREGQSQETRGDVRYTCRTCALGCVFLAPFAMYALVMLVCLPMKEGDDPSNRARAVTMLSGAQFGLGLYVLLGMVTAFGRAIPRILANLRAWYVWRPALTCLLWAASAGLWSYDGLARTLTPGTLPTLEQLAPGLGAVWDGTLPFLLAGATGIPELVKMIAVVVRRWREGRRPSYSPKRTW